MLREQADEHCDERKVAGPAGCTAPELVHRPDQLGVEPETAREGESPAVGPAERDPPGRARAAQNAGGFERVARQAERPRENARPASGDKADRDVAPHAVDRLVEAPVAGEDVDTVVAGAVLGELLRMAGALGEGRLDLAAGGQRLGHRTR